MFNPKSQGVMAPGCSKVRYPRVPCISITINTGYPGNLTYLVAFLLPLTFCTLCYGNSYEALHYILWYSTITLQIPSSLVDGLCVPLLSYLVKIQLSHAISQLSCRALFSFFALVELSLIHI